MLILGHSYRQFGCSFMLALGHLYTQHGFCFKKIIYRWISGCALDYRGPKVPGSFYWEVHFLINHVYGCIPAWRQNPYQVNGAVGPGYGSAACFSNVASDAWFRKVASGWRLTGIWLASGGRQAQCFETTCQTQYFKIRHQTQDLKIMRQTLFSETMHQTCSTSPAM